jgi:hypothetical protein
MDFDNQLFNVNGKGAEGLHLALKLAFLQDGYLKGLRHSK